jgi:hypothetical protein
MNIRKISNSKEKFNLIVISRNNYLLWHGSKLICHLPSKVYVKDFPFIIVKACHLKGKFIAVDGDGNIQMYNIQEQRLMSGFKKLEEGIIDICACKNFPILGVITRSEALVIDVVDRKIVRRTAISDIQTAIFADHRTMLLFGKGIHEYNTFNDIYKCVFKGGPDSSYKFFQENDGFYINYDEDEEEEKRCCCGKRYAYDEQTKNMIIDLKIELRREIYKIKDDIDELKKKIDKREQQ